MINKIKEKIKDWKRHRQIKKEIRHRDRVEKDPIIERVKVMLFLFNRKFNDEFLIANENSNKAFLFLPHKRFVLKSSKNWEKDDFHIYCFENGKIHYFKGWKEIKEEAK